MRTALISDIHGNLPGLRAVLDHIAGQGCDRILCLGDLVDGGTQGVEVVETIRERGIVTVRGNHDESAVWNHELPEAVREYLADLPEALIEGETYYTHTSPRQKNLKITSPIEAWNVFEETEWRRTFVGDVHIPFVYGQWCQEKVSATDYAIEYGREFRFQADDRYIVCVGAVGYTRDALPRLRYAIHDDERDSVTFHAPDGPLLRF